MKILKKLVLAALLSVSTLIVGAKVSGAMPANACSPCGCGSYLTNQSESAFNDSARVYGYFSCVWGSWVQDQSSAGTSAWGGIVAVQGPGWYYSNNQTLITFWYNVKFANGYCLYPRAQGDYEALTGGYDGANYSGSCSF